jgi:hypothetical protein
MMMIRDIMEIEPPNVSVEQQPCFVFERSWVKSLGPETSYFLVDFLNLSTQIPEYYLKLGDDASFRILARSLFIHHPIIRRHIV